MDVVHATTLPAAPRRIQRRRTKGWRLPAGAIYVGRPTRFGNPYHVEAPRHRSNYVVRRAVATVSYYQDCESAVRAFRAYVERDRALQRMIREQLRGRNLACWCPLVDWKGRPWPCHADVLLEVANAAQT